MPIDIQDFKKLLERLLESIHQTNGEKILEREKKMLTVTEEVKSRGNIIVLHLSSVRINKINSQLHQNN